MAQPNSTFVHPECLEGEVFMGNFLNSFEQRNLSGDLRYYNYIRFGNVAYNEDDSQVLTGFRPVFVLESEKKDREHVEQQGA